MASSNSMHWCCLSQDARAAERWNVLCGEIEHRFKCHERAIRIGWKPCTELTTFCIRFDGSEGLSSNSFAFMPEIEELARKNGLKAERFDAGVRFTWTPLWATP